MPTGFSPVYKIMKDGTDITGNFNSRTLQIKVKLKGGGGDSDTCEITIDDRDWKFAPVEVRAKLEIYLGYKEIGYAQMGVFEVATVDYEVSPRQIRIIGTSVPFTGTLKAPKVQAFENKTVGDVIQQLAQESGVQASVAPDVAGEKIPHLNLNSSPLHLIHELERRFGALAKFENGRLIFNKRDSGETTSGLGTMVLVLRPENVTRGLVRHTTRGDYASVKVGWYDENGIKRYVEEVDPTAPRGEDGQPGDPTFLSGRIGRTEGEAKAMAKSHLAALKRSNGELHVTLSKGDPWIRDQMRTLMTGFRDKVDGSYVNDTVTHTYMKDAGIQTHILGKPPGDGADYSSLNEGAFYALGSGGVVGPVGPQLPDGSAVGVPEAQLPFPSGPEPLPAPEPPVGT